MKPNQATQMFAREIWSRLSKLSPRLCKCTRTERTAAVAKMLRRMAKDRGYKLNPSRQRNEFMCDFTWLKWKRYHQAHIEHIGLVVECEWSHEHKSIIHDFRKLIFVKAPIKLFICQILSRDDAKFAKKRRALIANLLSSTRADLKGETYLLLELHREKQNGKRQEPPHLFYWMQGDSELKEWKKA